MSANTFVVGLTGGIGSGKSAVSHLFADLGIDIIDADIIAREVVLPDTPGLMAIVEHFGEDILQPDGLLDRAKLRERVFHNSADKQWLNELLHPLIRIGMQHAIEAAQSAYCVLAVPLLIENNMTGMVDRVLVVDCPPAMQLERAMQRDGSQEQTIRNIMAAQVDRPHRLAAAHDVIDNSGQLAALEPQVKYLHEAYLSLANQR